MVNFKNNPLQIGLEKVSIKGKFVFEKKVRCRLRWSGTHRYAFFLRIYKQRIISFEKPILSKGQLSIVRLKNIARKKLDTSLKKNVL